MASSSAREAWRCHGVFNYPPPKVIAKTSNIFGFMAGQNMSEASKKKVGGDPWFPPYQLALEIIGTTCKCCYIWHIRDLNIVPTCSNRYGIYIYMWISPASCHYALQIYAYTYNMHFHLRKLCLTISHETSNGSKVPLDHSGFVSSYKPNLHPLAMRQETNLKTVFNPTFKCLSVYISMHVGIIYI